jgi:hypothetical protein
MQHGYWSYCSTGKCSVCNTPWPEKSKSPITEYLEGTNYHTNYRSVYFPCNAGDGLEHVGGIFNGGEIQLPSGITGEELMLLRKQLNEEYKHLEGRSGGLEECKKRGALEGYNLDNIK